MPRKVLELYRNYTETIPKIAYKLLSKRVLAGGMMPDTRLTRTYNIEAATVEGIKRIVRQTGANDSRVVNELLSRALQEVEAGRWRVQRFPVKYDIKLE